MAEVAVLILAGGLGTRLGGRLKAVIPIGGMRLLDRRAAGFGACSPILVATGSHAVELFGLSDAMIQVADATLGTAGPIAGLAAGVEWLRLHRPHTEFVISVAVDTPYFPTDFVERTLARLNADIDVVVAAYDQQDYPTNALWRVAALDDLAVRCAADLAPRGLKGLIAEMRAARLDYGDSSTGNPFVNVNTPADLESLQRRAAGMRPPTP